MTYRVETLPQAERDGQAILEWLLVQKAGTAGLTWFLALEEAIASLAQHPERCPFAPENRDSPVPLRQLLYGRRPYIYRILFTVEADCVSILHIRHARRQPLRF